MEGKPPELLALLSMKVAAGGTNSSGNGTGAHFSFHDLVLQSDCYAPSMVMTNGVWLGENPLEYSLPLFLAQLLFIAFTTRAIAALLRPLHQPLVVAEILAGIVLGKTVMGRIFVSYRSLFFPIRSTNLLKTTSNMGLLFFVFIVGLEVDSSIFRHTGRKVISVAATGIILPFLISISMAYGLRSYLIQDHNYSTAFYIYIGIALSVTSFPVLARILLETKLIETEIGRIAFSTAMITEVLAWVHLAVGIAFTASGGARSSPHPSRLIVPAAVIFLLFFIFAVRPAVAWFMRRTPEGEEMSDMSSGTILIGVLVAGLIADMIGLHAAFGAFIYGFVIPPSPHATALIGRIEEFIKDLFLPLVFFESGFRVDLMAVSHPMHAVVLAFIFVVSNAVKIAATVLIAVYFGFQVLEGVALAFLVSPSGFVMLSIARDKKASFFRFTLCK